ncbi:hypothetical protein GCM10010218_03030 [Streptomyces mashuensis]|uniref:Secreted protein n=1 Tax=Streptomyces mashuensis TaxID=33904 RepID=A0A919ATT0_9ACTN|nr:hypothetical protein [Streptomyces mashuensis]GHF25731.1 hypothetical protein GCM10010218_03030 [Streptomyces mashuensis]
MRQRARVLALAFAAAAATAVAAAPAQAAPGDTLNVCASTLTPTGWVDTQWWTTGTCPGSSPNSKQIKQLTGLPVGTQVNACASTYPPAGWTIRQTYWSGSCQYSPVPSLSPNAWLLVRTS